MKINNWKFNNNIKFRREPFGGLIYNPKLGYTLEINKSAQLLLELLSAFIPLSRVQNIFSSYYKVDFKEIKNDFMRIIKMFIKYGILINGKCEDILNKIDVDKILHKPWPSQIVQNGLNIPEVIHLAITEECPLNCPGCYVDAGSPLKKELSTREILKFIDILEKHKIFQLGIGGGEALVRGDLLEIVSYTINKGITVAITTSGINLTQSMAEKLKLAGISQIQISHDGFSKKVFEETRSIGSYKIAKVAIKNLKSAGIEFGLNVLVTPNVLKELVKLITYAEEIGAVEIILLRPKPSGRKDKENWFEKNKLTTQHLMHLIKILSHLKTNLRIRTDTSFCLLYYNLNTKFLYSKGIFGCTGASRFCSINSDGSMFPCSHFFQYPEYNGGNCLKLIENWQNSKVFKSFREFRSSVAEPCFTCNNLRVCGGCRKIALLESGSFLGVDPYCLKIREE